MKFVKTGFAFLLIATSWQLYAQQPNFVVVDCPKPDEKKVVIDVDYTTGKALRQETTGGHPELYFRLPDGADRAEVTETARATRIEGDLRVLFDIARALTGGALTKSVEPQCVKIDQTYERSQLDVTPKNSMDKDAKYGKATILTGPTEGFWLSADMGLNNIKQLSLDQNNSLVEKEKPASFYVGFNWKLFGDVYKKYPVFSAESYKNISGKVLFRASGSPSDSMGLGVGYDFDWVNLFVARVWTKGDPGASGQIDTKASNVVGISFDLSRGLNWVKPSK